jgi:hypothetical protein
MAPTNAASEIVVLAAGDAGRMTQALAAAEAGATLGSSAAHRPPAGPRNSPQGHAARASVVQRNPDTGEAEAEPSGERDEAGTEPTEDPDEEQAGAPDMDELARRVYAEIKRRLSVEWERLRWRG